MSDIPTAIAERKPLPVRVAQFDVQGFVAWLAKNGAEIGIPTNAYEVTRYRAYSDGEKAARTHIIYAKESGLLTWPGETRRHYEAFLAGEQLWPGYPPNARGDTPFLVTMPDKGAHARYANFIDGVVSRAGGSPKGGARIVPGLQKSKAPTRAALLARDGDKCWFCGDHMGADCTIEHLVPKSSGGRDTAANYALAHAKCNREAADLPLVQKIELRQRKRSQFRMLADQ